jgi:hypothetical protein
MAKKKSGVGTAALRVQAAAIGFVIDLTSAWANALATRAVFSKSSTARRYREIGERSIQMFITLRKPAQTQAFSRAEAVASHER